MRRFGGSCRRGIESRPRGHAASGGAPASSGGGGAVRPSFLRRSMRRCPTPTTTTAATPSTTSCTSTRVSSCSSMLLLLARWSGARRRERRPPASAADGTRTQAAPSRASQRDENRAHRHGPPRSSATARHARDSLSARTCPVRSDGASAIGRRRARSRAIETTLSVCGKCTTLTYISCVRRQQVVLGCEHAEHGTGRR